MILSSEIRLTEWRGRVRPAGVAGYFYPARPGELRHRVEALLGGAPGGGPVPKAVIAPHASYVYSGPIAASAYARLRPARSRIRRVVLLGPSHRVYFQGLAAPLADRFATPLGDIPVDADLRRRVLALEPVRQREEAFDGEHSLEVHLPFLQAALEGFTLLPLVVGEAPAGQVAEVLETVWGGDETLLVISSDLSHYHDYETAVRLDRETARRIVAREEDGLGPEQACGCRPVCGLLRLARRRGLAVEALDIRNSGDTAGDRDRVVGYGAFALHEPAGAGRSEPGELEPDQKDQLLDVACASIDHGLAHDRPRLPDLRAYPAALARRHGLFVTLTRAEQLRGCIGHTEAIHPLVTGAAQSAFDAAFRDPRFQRLGRHELEGLRLDLSILSDRRPLRFESEQDLAGRLRPGHDGLVIRRGDRSATFLPSVWEHLPDPEDFLARLRHKAGIPTGRPIEAAWTYQTHSFGRTLVTGE